MKVIPAIDLLDGKAVRLSEGRRETATIYHERPWELISELAEAGADRVHVVDLEGAFHGARHQHDLVDRLLATSAVPVQVGGGIRTYTDVEHVVAAGARWVVLGTAAVKHPEMVEQMCRAHPDRIIVAVDARDGIVAVEGWVQSANLTAVELAQRAADWGAAAVLYTDVARDGTHGGPNVAATAALARSISIDVIASGGVSTLDDLRVLAGAGVPACIVGRALYDRHFTLAEAIEAAR